MSDSKHQVVEDKGYTTKMCQKKANNLLVFSSSVLRTTRS